MDHITSHVQTLLIGLCLQSSRVYMQENLINRPNFRSDSVEMPKELKKIKYSIILYQQKIKKIKIKKLQCITIHRNCPFTLVITVKVVFRHLRPRPSAQPLRAENTENIERNTLLHWRNQDNTGQVNKLLCFLCVCVANTQPPFL